MFTNFLKGSDVETTRALSGDAQADTLFKHYITPESAAVRQATDRTQKALLYEQKLHATKKPNQTKVRLVWEHSDHSKL